MNNNKKFALMALVLLEAVLATGCSVKPGAGEEAVLIQKPMFFGDGGVVQEPVHTGRTYVAPTTDHEIVNMRPRTFVIHFDDMMSSEGVPLDFDASVRLRVTNSVRMVEKFGVAEYDSGGGKSWPVWFDNNLYKPFETAVRQTVRKHGMNETAIDTTAIDDIDLEVSESLMAYAEKIGLPIEVEELTVGRANPPDAVKHQRVATAEQEQRINTEKQRKLAEDQRMEAERSRAAADNAYRNQMSLSPEQFLRLEQIRMMRETCKDGNCTFLVGDGVVPIMARK